MARFGGMSMESLSSARERLSSASSGLGSLLRDQKATTGVGRMNVLLGFSPPLAGAAETSHSLCPHSSSLCTDSNGFLISDEVELKDEELWGSDLSEDDRRSHPPDPLYRHQLLHAYEFSSAYSQMSFFSYHSNGDHGLKRAGTTGPAYGDAFKQENLLLLDGVYPAYDLAAGKSTKMPLSSGDVISAKTESKLFATVKKPSEPCTVANQGHISSRTISSAIKRIVLDSHLEVEHQSAPMNVPNWSKILQKDTANVFDCTEKVDEDNDNEDRLPPHELLAREYAQKERMTFSVCEGQGRTLKGRDMRRVRNAVWRQIGFAD